MIEVTTCKLFRRGARPYTSLPESCTLLVTVGNKNFQDDNLSSTLALINTEFKTCDIVVEGTLQRYNIATEKRISLKDVYEDGTLSKEAETPSENVLEASDIEQITEKVRKIDLEHTSSKPVFAKAISSEGIAGKEDKDILNAVYNEALDKENVIIGEIKKLICILDKNELRKCVFNIVNWDQYIKNINFKEYLTQINTLLENNEDMQKAMDKAVEELYEKRKNEVKGDVMKEIFASNSALYLKEECAVMFMWRGMLLYPSKPSDLLAAMRDHINKELSLTEKEKLVWQVFKHKKIRVSNLGEITSEQTSDFLDTAIIQKCIRLKEAPVDLKVNHSLEKAETLPVLFYSHLNGEKSTSNQASAMSIGSKELQEDLLEPLNQTMKITFNAFAEKRITIDEAVRCVQTVSLLQIKLEEALKAEESRKVQTYHREGAFLNTNVANKNQNHQGGKLTDKYLSLIQTWKTQILLEFKKEEDNSSDFNKRLTLDTISTLSMLEAKIIASDSERSSEKGMQGQLLQITP